MFFTSAFWKRQARAALKNHWLTALLIALVVSLPSLLVQGIAAATGTDLLNRLTDVLYESVGAGGAVMPGKLMSGLEELRNAAGIWIMQGLYLLSWLLTPCLTIGMVNWMLMRLRKQEAGDVSAVFSRMSVFFKGIGIRLYVAFRVFLWTLPGLALGAAAVLPILLSDRTSSISLLSAANTAAGIEYAAVAVTAALGVTAMLRYALGDMVLADHPETGPVKAAEESKRLTKGRKGLLFSLYLSFIFWYLAETAAANVILDLFGSIPALMTEMLCSLAITVYLHTSVTGFYLTVSESGKAGKETVPEEENKGPEEEEAEP